MANFFINRQIKNRNSGQAMVELAIFGSVLLLAMGLFLGYGMSSIQQQNFKMQSYRKAFVRASTRESDYATSTTDPHGYNSLGSIFDFLRRLLNSNSGRGAYDPGWGFENSNPPPVSNHQGYVNYVVIEDKATFSPVGVLPVMERSPIGGSTEAVRSIDLFAEYEGYPANPDDPNDPANQDLPRIEFEINGKRYSFTVAAFKEYDVTTLGQLLKKQDVPNWDGSGPSWEWVLVDPADLVQYDNVDVDGDLMEESVVENDTANGILKVLDYQEGEINFSEPYTETARPKGGLEEDYEKRVEVLSDGEVVGAADTNSYFRKQENHDSIRTTDNLNLRQTMFRTITVREGYEDKNGVVYADGVYPVDDELLTRTKSTWSTPR